MILVTQLSLYYCLVGKEYQAVCRLGVGLETQKHENPHPASFLLLTREYES